MSTNHSRHDDEKDSTNDSVVEMAAEQTDRSEDVVEAEMADTDVPVIGEDVSRDWLAGDSDE